MRKNIFYNFKIIVSSYGQQVIVILCNTSLVIALRIVQTGWSCTILKVSKTENGNYDINLLHVYRRYDIVNTREF